MYGRRPAQFFHTSHHMIFHPNILAGLAGIQNLFHLLIQFKVISVYDPAYILQSGVIRIGEAGGDHILVTSNNIRQNHRKGSCVLQISGKLSAFHCGELFAQHINLRNPGAAEQKLSCDLLNILQG